MIEGIREKVDVIVYFIIVFLGFFFEWFVCLEDLVKCGFLEWVVFDLGSVNILYCKVVNNLDMGFVYFIFID